MAYRMEFEHLVTYSTREPGIGVPVKLRFGHDTIGLTAKLDCGADACVFERLRGEELGLDIERGNREKFSTATGYFDAYGHFVTLMVMNYEFDVMIYFAKDEGFNRNVLGRIGFLDHLLIGLNDYEGKLYLEKIDSAFDE